MLHANGDHHVNVDSVLHTEDAARVRQPWGTKIHHKGAAHQVPSTVNESDSVPTAPPTVTTSGLAVLPRHTALVDDAHAIVEHSIEPSRPDGVTSANAKLNPAIRTLPPPCDAPVLDSAPPELITGAA